MTLGSGGCSIGIKNNIESSIVSTSGQTINLKIGTQLANESGLTATPISKAFKYLNSNAKSILFSSFHVFTAIEKTSYCYELDSSGLASFPKNILDDLSIGDKINVFTSCNVVSSSSNGNSYKTGHLILEIVSIGEYVCNCNILSSDDVIISSQYALTVGATTDSNSNCIIQLACKI